MRPLVDESYTEQCNTCGDEFEVIVEGETGGVIEPVGMPVDVWCERCEQMHFMCLYCRKWRRCDG